MKKSCLSEVIFVEYSNEESHILVSIWDEILPKNNVQDSSGRQDIEILDYVELKKSMEVTNDH